MTIAIAWIRQLSKFEELVFVSDSRLSGDGFNFDACPKILSLSRTDCAISFAGDTGQAFPMMLQLGRSIDAYAPSRRGGVKLSAVKQHALKVFDKMYTQRSQSPLIHGSFEDLRRPTFLFGGYSWFRKRFQLWTISYSEKKGKFEAHPASWACYLEEFGKVRLRREHSRTGTRSLGQIAFAGDQAPIARERLFECLAAKRASSIDFEPFEIVRDMLRDANHSETIGGVPQVVKVYQYMNTAPLAVYWPRKDSENSPIYLEGRLCLDYENIDRWVLDPDTFVSESTNYSGQVDDEIDWSVNNGEEEQEDLDGGSDDATGEE
jgi:hypothetical protein